MSLDKLKELIETSTDLKICCICGMPFKPRHSRQKTCGSPECKTAHHNNYSKAYQKKMRQTDPEVAKAYHREVQQRYRKKKRDAKAMMKKITEIRDDWEKATKPDEDGLNYGKRQAEKLLQSVPKIDVSMGGQNDTVHTEDVGERSE